MYIIFKLVMTVKFIMNNSKNALFVMAEALSSAGKLF